MNYMESVNKIKESINSYLTNESSKEEIDKITYASSLLDKMAEAYNNQSKELSEMKDSYIKMVKTTGYSLSHSKEEDVSPKEYTVSEFLKKFRGE